MTGLVTQYHTLKATSYQDIWDFQMVLHNRLKMQKRNDMKGSGWSKPINHLILCEHKPVFTLGKSGKRSHLLISEEEASAKNVEFFKINRGGDITYHGPGQFTGYLILDLELLYRDVHKYVKTIEEVIIRLLAEYKIIGQRLEDFTGVWVLNKSKQLKVCAIGIHLSRWVSMHGFGLNVNTNLDNFNMIVPCGIQDPNKSVTSISSLLGEEIDMFELEMKLKKICVELFQLQLLVI